MCVCGRMRGWHAYREYFSVCVCVCLFVRMLAHLHASVPPESGHITSWKNLVCVQKQSVCMCIIQVCIFKRDGEGTLRVSKS